MMNMLFGACSERGAEYEFRIAARNNVDFGSYTAEVIKTPDGRT